jgi:hypothetical protein
MKFGVGMYVKRCWVNLILFSVNPVCSMVREVNISKYSNPSSSTEVVWGGGGSRRAGQNRVVQTFRGKNWVTGMQTLMDLLHHLK